MNNPQNGSIAVSKSSTGNSVGRFGLELLSIFIAVFLAFGVNEWREARRNASLADRALQAIISEMHRNKAIIEQVLPGHEEIRKVSGTATSIDMISSDSLFFMPIILRNTAWRTASESGAFSYMDYADATAIAEIYTFQEAYASLTQSMMASSFDIDNHDENKRDAQLGVLRFMSFIFVENEQELLKAYVKALSTLNE